MKYLILVVAALAAGCSKTPEQELFGVDQCIRVERFNSCMSILPSGPLATKYNDWSEVVSECNDISRQQSLRPQKLIKPECSTGKSY